MANIAVYDVLFNFHTFVPPADKFVWNIHNQQLEVISTYQIRQFQKLQFAEEFIK